MDANEALKLEWATMQVDVCLLQIAVIAAIQIHPDRDRVIQSIANGAKDVEDGWRKNGADEMLQQLLRDRLTHLLSQSRVEDLPSGPAPH